MLIAELHQAAKKHLSGMPLCDLLLHVKPQTAADGHLLPHVIANLKMTLTVGAKMTPSEGAKKQMQEMLDALPQ